MWQSRTGGQPHNTLRNRSGARPGSQAPVASRGVNGALAASAAADHMGDDRCQGNEDRRAIPRLSNTDATRRLSHRHWSLYPTSIRPRG